MVLAVRCTFYVDSHYIKIDTFLPYCAHYCIESFALEELHCVIKDLMYAKYLG